MATGRLAGWARLRLMERGPSAPAVVRGHLRVTHALTRLSAEAAGPDQRVSDTRTLHSHLHFGKGGLVWRLSQCRELGPWLKATEILAFLLMIQF